MSKAPPRVIELTAVIPVVDEDIGVALCDEIRRCSEKAVRHERLHREVEIARSSRGCNVIVLKSVNREGGGKVLLNERDDLRAEL